MPDVHDVAQVFGLEDVEQVIRVAVQRVVLAAVVCVEIRAARADTIKDDDAVVGLKLRDDVPPDHLTATKTVREDDRPACRITGNVNVIPAASISRAGQRKHHFSS